MLIYLAAVQRSGGHITARPRSAGWQQAAAAGVMIAARTIQANNTWCQLYYKYNIWRRDLLGWGHVCQSVFIWLQRNELIYWHNKTKNLWLADRTEHAMIVPFIVCIRFRFTGVTCQDLLWFWQSMIKLIIIIVIDWWMWMWLKYTIRSIVCET